MGQQYRYGCTVFVAYTVANFVDSTFFRHLELAVLVKSALFEKEADLIA